MKVIFYLMLFCLIVIPIGYSETNGIWHHPEDVLEGTFGADQANSAYYIFQSRVNFTHSLFIKEINLYPYLLDLRNDTDNNSKRLTSAEGRIGVLEVEMDDAENRLDSAENRLDSAETRLDSAETRLNSAETRLTTAEDKIVNHENRISTNEKDLVVVKDWKNCGGMKHGSSTSMVRSCTYTYSCNCGKYGCSRCRANGHRTFTYTCHFGNILTSHTSCR